MIYIYIYHYTDRAGKRCRYISESIHMHIWHMRMWMMCIYAHLCTINFCMNVGRSVSWRGDWPASHSELADTGKLTQTCSERDQTPEQTVWKRRFKALLKSLDMERGTGMTQHVLIILVVLSSALLFLWCQDVPGTLQGSCKHQEKSQQERKQSEWCCCCWWWWW